MSMIKMTATYTFKGVSMTSGSTYRLRAREVEELVAANKGNKGLKK